MNVSVMKMGCCYLVNTIVQVLEYPSLCDSHFVSREIRSSSIKPYRFHFKKDIMASQGNEQGI